MKKIKKLVAALVFLTGLVIVVDIIIPGSLAKVKELPLISPFIEKVDNFAKKSQEDFQDVLGKSTDAKSSKSINKKEVANTIKNISSQVLESEAGQIAQEQVGEVLNQATEEIKDLPEQQIKKIKGEVKRQICEEMLKDY